jgi:RNA polymerase sigma-70 factor (ECF subfamily)
MTDQRPTDEGFSSHVGPEAWNADRSPAPEMSTDEAGNGEFDFDAVVRETHPHIRAYIAGMGVPRHDVDDVAQDVYVELYRFSHKIPDGVHPKQWLKGIARNLCLNYFRRQGRRQRLQREALVEILIRAEQEGPPSLAEGPIRRALDGCYEQLPEESRQLLQLRYEKELPSQTIAEMLSSTAEAIRVALFRIRNGLKQCIASSLAAEGT